MRQPLWNSPLWPWSIFLTVASAIVMMIYGSWLEKITPHAIVALELAGSATRTQQLFTAWGADGQRLAGFLLGFDFLFIAAYSTSIALACLWAQDGFNEQGWPLAGLGGFLAIAVPIGGLFDSIENISLLNQLLYGVSDGWALAARILALSKFVLVIAGMVFFALGALANRRPIVGLIVGLIAVMIARPVIACL